MLVGQYFHNDSEKQSVVAKTLYLKEDEDVAHLPASDDKGFARKRWSWRAPIGWSALNVSALSAFGPSERCFLVQADDSPMNCVA